MSEQPDQQPSAPDNGGQAPNGPAGHRPQRPTAQFRPQQPAKKGMNGCLVGMLVAMLLGGGVALVALFAIFAAGAGGAGGGYAAIGPNEVPVESGDRNKIVIIPVHGIIQSGLGGGQGSSDMLISYIRKAASDKNVKAIILDMNTPGGEVTATDEVYHELQKIREDHGVYTVTCMRSMAASGGYYLAAGTDHIVANRLTFTGSIGVIIAGYNYSGLLEKVGVQPEVYHTGDNKDILSMSRPRRDDEVEIINALVDETYNEFAEIVIKGRSGAGVTREKFEATAEIHDSRVLSGAQAHKLGLVDELGYMEDAIVHARSACGSPGATVVRYVSPPSVLDLLMGAEAEPEHMPKSLADWVSGSNPQIRKGCMYYLSPMAY